MIDSQLREAVRLAGTPCYVFDARKLGYRVAFLREHLPSEIGLCYAMKANPFLLKEISPLVDRIEICSPGELTIAGKLDIPLKQYVVSGVNKDPERIQSMVSAGTGEEIFTVESMRQLSILLQSAQREQKRCSVLLRLTSGNQFGMREDEVEYILCCHKKDPWLCIRGIQYFSGTQKRSLSRLRREIEYLDGFLARLDKLYGPLEELEYGPGFSVAYFQGEEYDEPEYLASFSEILQGMRFSGKTTLELGRSLAADCGYYLTRICDLKENCGQNYAIIDGGIHQIVYYGQSMAMRHPPVRFLSPHLPGQVKEWNIFGSLCTTNDVLVKRLPLEGLRLGDVLVFEKAGAYSVTEGIALFLSRELPAVVLIREDGVPVCIRGITPTDPFNTPAYQMEVR